MVSNGHQGNRPPDTRSHLRLVSNSVCDRSIDSDLNENFVESQTLSFSTDASQSINKISAMCDKGYTLAAVAGQDGKLITAFTKSSDTKGLTVIDVAGADPGIDYAYRLSNNTLEHIAHDGENWLFAYLPEKKFRSQRVIKSDTLNGILALIKSSWKHNYRVTSLAFGNGYWLAVVTQRANLDDQSYFTACDTETLQEKTKQSWKEGRSITAITYGDGKWLVIMDKGTGYKAQKWFTRRSFTDLRSKLREEWVRQFRVTALAKGESSWLAVVSKS